MARRTRARDGDLLQSRHRDVDAVQSQIEITPQAPGKYRLVRAECRVDGGGIARVVLQDAQAIVGEDVERGGLVELDAVVMQ